jgi:hypothetical protein
MPQNPDNVVNPGLVDVADQGDGPLSVDQPVSVARGAALPQTTASAAPAGGAPATSTNPDLVDVADQGFNGLPRNVFP